MQTWLDRHARLLRWTLVPLLVIIFGGLYSERASHAGYWPPKKVFTASGKLVAPQSRRSATITVITGDGGRLQLLCNPNERWLLCASRQRLQAHDGRPVNVRYYRFDAAYRGNLVVLSLRTADGITLVDGESQRQELLRASARDSGRNWAATVPFSLFVALLLCLGLEARAAWLVWLSRIRPKSQIQG